MYSAKCHKGSRLAVGLILGVGSFLITFKIFSLTLILAAPPHARAQAATCSSLDFIAVAPQGPGKNVDCDPYYDRHACQIKQGFSHFAHATNADGKKALRLRRASPGSKAISRYLAPLERSPAVREINELRIVARDLVRQETKTDVDVCEPNYIYIGGEKVFNVGPAFASSTRFLIDGRETTNFILAEDAKAPYHIPLSMISKDSLIENHYYDIVVAHELAHGLLQDLYGVEHFEHLEANVVTRDGHFASGTTDPRLAWIEGFAEGFEAYLGEKYLKPHQTRTPHLEKVVRQALDRMALFEEYGWSRYVWTIPSTIFETGRLIVKMDDFVSDFLKAERQDAIRENHYVLKGAFNNLAHKYEIPFGSLAMADMDALIQYEIESTDAVYSKEGVVAHLVYQILKHGLARQMFETIVWGKPNDVWEFINYFRSDLSAADFAKIEPAYKAIFTAAGRLATRGLIKNPTARPAFEAKITAIPAIEDLAPPHDMFIEFANRAFLHKKLNGRLDRINLSTASAYRIERALYRLKLPPQTRASVAESFMRARERWPNESTVDALVTRWSASDQRIEVARAAQEFLTFRRCFENRCLSSPH